VRILVVDDDRAVRDALRRALTLGSYEVQCAEDGEQALELVVQAVPDAVVLDVGLPGIDGLEVCRRLRLLGNRVPILILTARDAVADRIDGLDVGADDYMEYQLLELLMLNPRRVLQHSLIYDRVWGYDFGPASNALRVYVGYLRRKLEGAGARQLIHTVRGVGYVLREP
jgi:two-component system response regulator MprA